MKVADFWLLSGNISATSCKTVMENVFYYETTMALVYFAI